MLGINQNTLKISLLLIKKHEITLKINDILKIFRVPSYVARKIEH